MNTDSSNGPAPGLSPDRGPRTILVMGVSGCGKTHVGSELATALDYRFVDADDYHPRANVDKMRAGQPLDDHDRAPWLARLNALLRHSAARNQPVVLACSALRERYRERLAHRLPTLTVVHLRGSPETIAERLAARNHRYMPASLLQSQFEALEPPTGAVIEVDITPDVSSIVQTLLAALRVP